MLTSPKIQWNIGSWGLEAWNKGAGAWGLSGPGGLGPGWGRWAGVGGGGGLGPEGTGRTFVRSFVRSFGRMDGKFYRTESSIGHRPLRARCPKASKSLPSQMNPVPT